MLCFILIIAVSFCVMDTGLSEKTTLLVFPEDPQVHADTTDGLPKGKTLTAFTFCAWIKSSKKGAVILAHRVTRGKTQIRLGINVQQGFAAAHVMDGSFFYNYLNGKVEIWFHYCVTWSNKTAPHLYLEGERSYNVESWMQATISPSTGGHIRMGNEFVIASASPDAFSFHGSMYQVNMWSRHLTQQEIADLACCNNSVADGDILGWSTLPQNLELSNGVRFQEGDGPCPLKKKPSVCSNGLTDESTTDESSEETCSGNFFKKVYHSSRGYCCYVKRIPVVKYVWCLPYYVRRMKGKSKTKKNKKNKSKVTPLPKYLATEYLTN